MCCTILREDSPCPWDVFSDFPCCFTHFQRWANKCLENKMKVMASPTVSHQICLSNLEGDDSHIIFKCEQRVYSITSTLSEVEMIADYLEFVNLLEKAKFIRRG